MVGEEGSLRTSYARRGRDSDGRTAIVDAAARQFSARGYATTTLDDIAEALGSTKGRIYHYYRSKWELLFDVLLTCMHDLMSAVSASMDNDSHATGRVRQMVLAHALTMMNRIDYQRVAVSLLDRNIESGQGHVTMPDEILVLRRDYEELFRSAIRLAIKQGEFLPRDADLAVKYVLGALNWITIWYRPEGALNPEEIAEQFADLIMHGLCAGQLTNEPMANQIRECDE